MYADALTSVADILATSVTNGEVRANLGDVDTAEGIAADAPMWGLDGFVSRPNDPSADGAAQAIYIQDGQIKRIVSTRDNRFAEKVGAMGPGDRIIVSSGNARFLLKVDEDSVSLYTVSAVTGSSMLVSLNGSAGRIDFANGNAKGKIEDEEIAFAINGGSSVLVGKDEIQLNAKSIALNGGTVTIGMMPGGAPFVPAVNGALIGPNGPAGVPSTKVMVAP